MLRSYRHCSISSSFLDPRSPLEFQAPSPARRASSRWPTTSRTRSMCSRTTSDSSRSKRWAKGRLGGTGWWFKLPSSSSSLDVRWQQTTRRFWSDNAVSAIRFSVAASSLSTAHTSIVVSFVVEHCRECLKGLMKSWTLASQCQIYSSTQPLRRVETSAAYGSAFSELTTEKSKNDWIIGGRRSKGTTARTMIRSSFLAYRRLLELSSIVENEELKKLLLTNLFDYSLSVLRTPFIHV